MDQSVTEEVMRVILQLCVCVGERILDLLVACNEIGTLNLAEVCEYGSCVADGSRK